MLVTTDSFVLWGVIGCWFWFSCFRLTGDDACFFVALSCFCFDLVFGVCATFVVCTCAGFDLIVLALVLVFTLAVLVVKYLVGWAVAGFAEGGLVLVYTLRVWVFMATVLFGVWLLICGCSGVFADWFVLGLDSGGFYCFVAVYGLRERCVVGFVWWVVWLP